MSLPINNPSPITENDLVYDLLSVSVALTTQPSSDEPIALRSVVKLSPYRLGENGVKTLENHDHIISVADGSADPDSPVGRLVNVITNALQQYANEVL